MSQYPPDLSKPLPIPDPEFDPTAYAAQPHAPYIPEDVPVAQQWAPPPVYPQYAPPPVYANTVSPNFVINAHAHAGGYGYRGPGVNHVLHFTMTVLTCGLWAPVWFIAWLAGRNR